MNLLKSFRASRLGLMLVLALTAQLITPAAHAHYCGPPVIRCKPGDVVTYYIVSDRAEQGISFFGVVSQTRPDVAPVVFFTPTGRIMGTFVIEAREVGTNSMILGWDFPTPPPASGFCFVEVRVTTNETTSTSGNSPDSAFAGDPVNAYTGELVMQEAPDLWLGGPLPLQFSRYYASRLQADSLVNSRIGNNWTHNFEWSAILGLTNQALIVSPQGLAVRFDRVGTNWMLRSPTFMPFQLVDSGTNVIFGDPRANLSYTFSTNGLLMSVSDGKGNAHSLTYTEERLLNQVSDGLGRSLTFSYVGAQLLNRVSDGTREVRLVFAQSGSDFNLLRITNALGGTTFHTYDNSKSIRSLLTSTTFPAGNFGYSQVYDDQGRVVQQSRMGTNITRFNYSPGNITYVTNAAGGVTVYSHSANGVLLAMKDAAGKSLTVQTNSQGRRAAIIDRTGASVGAAFHPASGLPGAFTNSDGSVTQFTYTNRIVNGITFHEVASVTLPGGSTQRFSYDAMGNLAAFQDPAGHVARFGYNARGQLTAATNAAGGVTTLVYNADGTIASRTDPVLGTITFHHDALRRVTNATAADGRAVRVVLDAADRIRAITDERTNTTWFAFDANDRLIGITNAAGHVARFQYDAADRLNEVVDRMERRLAYTYNSFDQISTFTNRNGNVMQFAWDARQRLTSIVDAAGKARTFGSDDEDLVRSFTDALGNSMAVDRDAVGFVSAITNQLGLVSVLNRDALHRVFRTVDPMGHIDQFGHEPRSSLTNANRSALGPATAVFNALGMMERLVDQGGSQWRFEYSNMGRLLRSVDPLNRTNSVSYDSRGRPARVAFADGASQTNSFDPSGNLTKLEFSGGPAAAFSYDVLHRLTNAAGLALAYDPEDRVTNTLSSGIQFGAAFDSGGRLTNVTYNNGSFSAVYSYDSRDRLIQVRDTLGNGQVNFFYDDGGRLTNVFRANGINGIYTHDAAGKVTRIREGNLIDLQFTYSAAGLMVALASETPLFSAPDAPETRDFTFDVAHQVSAAGYSYDGRGRMTASPGRTYGWNAASQLIRAGGVTNAFNGVGNLLARSTSAATITYHYNHAIHRVPIVAEQNAANSAFQRYYVWTPDGRLLYSIDGAGGNSVTYYHFDLNGSTLALSSAAGALSAAYAYSPYGLIVAQSGAADQPFRYAGQYGVRWDSDAQLYHMRARFYDPLTARFLSRDPLWPMLSDPLSLNPYAYAANNPLQFIDPAGTRNERLAESANPLQVIGRDDVSKAGMENVSDVLAALPASIGALSAASSLNLRGLGSDRTLVLLNGVRSSPAADLNSIPLAAVDRVEVLKDGASSVYGSDAVAGAVNVITRRTENEFDYLTLNVGAEFEPILSTTVNHWADQGAEFSIVQPIRRTGQVNLFQLSTESFMVGIYGALLQSGPTDLRGNSQTQDQMNFSLWMAGFPPMLMPRGVAFVNGQQVKPKLADLTYGFWVHWHLYNAMYSSSRQRRLLYSELLDSFQWGGTGGSWSDVTGTYRY
ncbi:MAG TPA: TonB-dependent receptor plug domain-containing protein [Verrucomicrobiae bacterium]|nr:TonB-dependent receptor plug domain-containing protein [Verrucomicrobiae bacterium]